MFQQGCWQTHHRADALPVAMAARLRFRFLKVDLPIRWRSAASCKKERCMVQVTLDADNMCMSHTHVRQQNRRPALCCMCACIDSSCVERHLKNPVCRLLLVNINNGQNSNAHINSDYAVRARMPTRGTTYANFHQEFAHAGPPGPRSVT